MSEYVDFTEQYNFDHDNKINLQNQLQLYEIRFEDFDQTGTLMRKQTLRMDTR